MRNLRYFLAFAGLFWFLLCCIYVLIGQIGLWTTLPIALIMGITTICIIQPTKKAVMVRKVRKQVRRKQQKRPLLKSAKR